jgi:flagellar biogenesis protein FliO
MFWYASALALVAVVLAGAAYALRLLSRSRIVAPGGTRLVRVVESTFVAPAVGVHLLKVGDRYVLVGGGSAGVTHIADVAADAVAPSIEAQRTALAQQRAALVRLVRRFRRAP